MIPRNWVDRIGGEFDIDGEPDYKRYMAQMEQFLQREESAGHIIYPERKDIFNALKLTAFDDVKVVILGQDPYHGKGQAHGLCFSVPKGIDIPRSLRNIYEEIDKEFDPIKMPSHGDLTGWAAQGVLLLNATLTVRQSEPGSHQGEGWEKFTDAVIRAVNEKHEHVVFLLWGSDAQKKGALIDRNKHWVLEASHPSPRSAYPSRRSTVRSFVGCGHFKKANECLEKHGRKPVQWQKI